MTTPDHRIQFPGPKIDFENDVGLTGQDHDNYPEPGVARYDYLRLYLIGLLSNQSGTTEPSQYREGTLWFDKNTDIMKLYNNGAFDTIAKAISLADSVTLQSWYNQLSSYLETFGPEVTFSGAATATANSITIPESLRQYVGDNTRCYLYINGLLQDPRKVQIQNATVVNFSDFSLTNGDEFTVVLKTISDSYFYTSTVSVP